MVAGPREWPASHAHGLEAQLTLKAIFRGIKSSIKGTKNVHVARMGFRRNQ